MSQERMGEIERLLTVAEDELSYVQKQRQFLLDQIASLKRERENSVFVDDNLEPYPDQLLRGALNRGIGGRIHRGIC